MDGMLPTRRDFGWLALATSTLGLVATGLAGCSGYIGTTAASFLRRIQKDPDPNVRFLAYAKLGSPNCYDNEEQKVAVARVLIAKLEQGQEPVASRAVICRTLGELRAKDAREALIRAVDDPEGMVRVEACRALGKVGRPQDATILSRIMTVDPLLDCKIAAIDGLAELKPDDIRIDQVLVEGMDSDLPAIRLASLNALRSITRKDFGVDPKPWREFVQAKMKSASAPSGNKPSVSQSPSSTIRSLLRGVSN
jgi:HEAT repeats